VGVSCRSSEACTAVGHYVNSASVEVPLAERWNGKVWAILTTATPKEAKSSSLSGVSCRSGETCNGTGHYVSSSGVETALAETYTLHAPYVKTGPATNVKATEATLQGIVNPEGQETTYHFEYGKTTSYGTSIPVPSASVEAGTNDLEESRVITGLEPETTYHFRVVAINGTGVTNGVDDTLTTPPLSWTADEPPNPTGGKQDVLTGLSCTSATACIAAGYFYNSSEKYMPLAESWNGTGWSLQEPPNPSGAKESFLTGGASCTSSTACIAVGRLYNNSGEMAPLAENWNGTAWSAQEPPRPTGGEYEELSGVSCASSTACMAAGRFYNSAKHYVPLAEKWNGTAWVIQEPPLPTGAKNGVLNGVSCTSSTACTAAGSVANVPMTEIWNGTAWSPQEPPLPTGTKEGFLAGVSCTSSMACIAVGSFTNSSGKSVPLAESWNGTGWSVQEPPNPTGATQAYATSVSCSSSATCIAVGYFINGSEKNVPMAESWNGTVWSVRELPSPLGGLGSFLNGVSCASSSSCFAAGSFFNESGIEMTLAEDYA
jgi:hypothetical protein